MLYSPSVSSFSIMGVTVHYYGLIIAVAICVCLGTLDLICKKIRTNLSCDIFYDLSVPLIIFSIIGARLYYVFLNYEYYFNHPNEIFMIWQGGLSIHGAIILGILLMILFFKYKKTSILPYLDVIACVFPLGQAIGRWGNYVNQEAFGKPCNYIWCLYIEPQFRSFKYKQYDFFHPTFLYESFLDLIIFIILFCLLARCKNLKSGIIFSLYLILYSIIRIFIEFIRTDSSVYLWGISFPIIVSGVFIFIGIIFLINIYKNNFN